MRKYWEIAAKSPTRYVPSGEFKQLLEQVGVKL